MHRVEGTHTEFDDHDRRRRRFKRPRRPVMMAIALAVAAAATTVGAAASTAGTPDAESAQLVQTANGAVRGVVTDNYRVFNGIPYARPPVAQLRWQAPEPVAAWSGVRDATKPGSDCVQTAEIGRAHV